MKISVARHHPLSLSHGEQPIGHLCRQYSSMGSSAIESLECLREKQQLWWTHLGPDFSTEFFPPDDHLTSSFTSNDAKFMKERQNCIKPPLLSKRMAVMTNQQHQYLAQAIPGSFQSYCQDHTETVQELLPHGDAGVAMEQSMDHSHADLAYSDEEPHSQSSVLISECHYEHQSAEGTSENLAMERVKLMCSFGGRIMARPVDGKLRYVGGETRIVAVCKDISFSEFMSKMAQFYGAPLGLKYQLPDEDLDALVSVSSDDDLQNMMEEYDKAASSGGTASRLRLFFFSTPAELEVVDMKLEGEDVCSFPDQRYVEAINGASAKLHVNLSEDDAAGFRHVDGIKYTDGCGRVPLLEQANEITQCSAPSSSPSSPIASGQAFYLKPPGLLDISLQNLNDSLSKVTMAPLGFEGDVDQEAFGSSSTPFHYQYEHPQYDPQFSQAVESAKVTHPDGSVSRCGENWLGLRRVDSQSKLAHLPDHHSEYRTSLGGPSEHRHEVQYLRDAPMPQGEHQRLNQQHMLSLPYLQQSHHHQQQHQHQHQHQHHQHQNQNQNQNQHQHLPTNQHQHQQQYHHPHHQQQQQQQHHHHHHNHNHHQQQQTYQQQQSWYPLNDGDTGRGEHSSHQEMHKQSQIVHQHHQLPYHHPHLNASVHDGSWSNEHHGVPRSISSQFLHGLAPAPPYQLGSAPSSPRVGVYDYQGKCACGLQHSQVHRGITVSIGEQIYNRRSPFPGDQGSRKQTLRSSSRFYDSSSHGADPMTWQQANHSVVTVEAEHKELVGHWPQNHARYQRDSQSVDCQARNRNMQYSEPLGHNGENLSTLDQADLSKRCQCMNCVDNRRQQLEMTLGHSALSESDQASEWFLHRKGFDIDNGRASASRKVFPTVSMFKDEEHHNVDERICEVESGLCGGGSQLPGDPDSRRAIAIHIERARKSQLSSGAMTGRSAVPDETMMPHPLAPRASDWHSKLATTKTSLDVGVPWNIAPSESRNRCNVPSSQQGQIPPAKDMLIMKLASSSSLVVEGAENFDKSGPFSEAHYGDGGAVTPLFLCGNNFPGGVGRVAGDTLGHPSAKSGLEFVDQGNNAVNLSAGHGNEHLLCPDVPLGSIAPASADLHSPSNMDNTEQTVVSPIFYHSPSSSTNMAKFSFAAGKAMLPPPEVNLDKEPLILGMSAAAGLTDSLASSVLDSDETLTWEMENLDQEATYKESQPVSQKEENISGVKMESELVSLEANVLNPVAEDDALGSPVIKGNTPDGGLEEIVDKTSTADRCLQGNMKEELRASQTVTSGGSNKTSCQEVSEVEAPGTSGRKEQSLSEAEAEAIARGLQIIKNSDLEDMKELGSGTYGTVYHGKWRGSDVAIKRIKASCFNGPPSERERLMADFWREACTLGQLHHPNVVAFYGIVPDGPGGTLATVTEYMVNGSLKQVLHKKDRTIDRRKRLFIAMDAAFGMEYLHSKNIVHFDLKCENLLVNMRDAHRPICKVGDFGLSKVKHHTLVSGGVRGTLPWMAPELLSGNCSMVSEKIDVFSFGVVMWELLTGEEPYANMHCGAIIGGIVNNSLRPPIPSWCDPGWRSLMERCWSGNPTERPPFAEVARELRAIAATMNLK